MSDPCASEPIAVDLNAAPAAPMDPQPPSSPAPNGPLSQPAKKVLAPVPARRKVWPLALLGSIILGTAGAACGYLAAPSCYVGIGHIQIITDYIQVFPGEPVLPRTDFDRLFNTQVELIQLQDTCRRAIHSSAWRAIAPAVVSEEEQIAAFQERLEVTHPAGTELIVVRFRDENPSVAKIAVMSLVNAYKELVSSFMPDSYRDLMEQLRTRRTEYQNRVSVLQRLMAEAAPDLRPEDLQRQADMVLDRIIQLRTRLAEEQSAQTTTAQTASTMAGTSKNALAQLQVELADRQSNLANLVATQRKMDQWLEELTVNKARLRLIEDRIFYFESEHPLNAIDRRIRISEAGLDPHPERPQQAAITTAGAGIGALLGAVVTALVSRWQVRNPKTTIVAEPVSSLQPSPLTSDAASP